MPLTPQTPAITIRLAVPRERVAIRAARWPHLPPWAGAAECLRVAVSGHREMLLGCAWECPSGDVLEAGVAVSPGNRLAEAAREVLIASFHPRPGRAIQWTEWLDADDPRVALLERAGFVSGQRMMSYEIHNHPEGHERLARGLRGAGSRMSEAGLEWGGLDKRAVPEVRLATLQEGLMPARDFDFLYHSGAFDPKVSPVVWQNGRLVGFIVVMAREIFEVALLYIRKDLRSTGVNALLLAEVIRRKTEASPDWQAIHFRGNLEINPRTRRMCQRFGGREQTACVKLHLPPASPTS
jgi:GNAT superfamily N-acetyltransferase